MKCLILIFSLTIAAAAQDCVTQRLSCYENGVYKTTVPTTSLPPNQQGAGSTFYVSVNGNDSNTGFSWDTALLTIGKAETLLAAGGGSIFVGCGNFPLTSTLNLTKPTHLVGCSTGMLENDGQTILAPTAGVVAIVVSGTHSILENLVVSGSSSTLGVDDGIVLTSGLPVLRNILVNDVGRRGIWANSSIQWYFENVTAQYNRGDNFYFTDFATNGICLNCSGNNSVGGWGFNDENACRNTFISAETQANAAGAVRINCGSDIWIGLSIDISALSLLNLTANSFSNYVQFNSGGVATTITNSASGSYNRINYVGASGIPGWTGLELIPNKGAGTPTTYSLTSGAPGDGFFSLYDATNAKFLTEYDPINSKWYFTQDVSMGSIPNGGAVNLYLGKSAFSALPVCASGTEGVLRAVTDSNTATWGATIAGGGSNRVLAYCNGSNWTVGAK